MGREKGIKGLPSMKREALCGSGSSMAIVKAYSRRIGRLIASIVFFTVKNLLQSVAVYAVFKARQAEWEPLRQGRVSGEYRLPYMCNFCHYRMSSL